MNQWTRVFGHILIICLVILFFLPLYLAFVAASHEAKDFIQAPMPMLPGGMLFHNFKTVLTMGIGSAGGLPVGVMLVNSLIMALIIAFGKMFLALISAYALVYFRFPGQKLAFACIFATMMLPVEVRILPTFQLIANFGWLNSYAGLTLPLMASATATFLLRQFMLTIPEALVDAARMDGAGPLRFFKDMIIPLSKTPMAALFVILFVYGWNQYLWPLVVTTQPAMSTVVMGIRYLAGVADEIPQWQLIMSVALIALIPPCMMVLLMQRWFEKGLTH